MNLRNAVAIMLILVINACQTERLEHQNSIKLIDEAIEYLKTENLIDERRLTVSFISSELIRDGAFEAKINALYNRLPIEEAFAQNLNNHLFFNVVNSKSMKFSFKDQFGNYSRYFLEYSNKTNTYNVSKRNDLKKVY